MDTASRSSHFGAASVNAGGRAPRPFEAGSLCISLSFSVVTREGGGEVTVPREGEIGRLSPFRASERSEPIAEILRPIDHLLAT